MEHSSKLMRELALAAGVCQLSIFETRYGRQSLGIVCRKKHTHTILKAVVRHACLREVRAETKTKRTDRQKHNYPMSPQMTLGMYTWYRYQLFAVFT